MFTSYYVSTSNRLSTRYSFVVCTAYMFSTSVTAPWERMCTAYVFSASVTAPWERMSTAYMFSASVTAPWERMSTAYMFSTSVTAPWERMCSAYMFSTSVTTPWERINIGLDYIQSLGIYVYLFPSNICIYVIKFESMVFLLRH